jgi:hypothetical protein
VGQRQGESLYEAKAWSHRRRVIIKDDVVGYPNREAQDNPRFVIINLKGMPELVYGVHHQRGDAENRIKELHHGLEIGRTSCILYLPTNFVCC